MRKRLASLLVGAGVDGEVPRPSPPPILTAIRRTFQAGYDRKALTADVLAGLVVGIVAIPLSMALAIAVDAPPQNGLYTAVVAGAVVAVLGGSKFRSPARRRRSSSSSRRSSPSTASAACSRRGCSPG